MGDKKEGAMHQIALGLKFGQAYYYGTSHGELCRTRSTRNLAIPTNRPFSWHSLSQPLFHFPGETSAKANGMLWSAHLEFPNTIVWKLSLPIAAKVCGGPRRSPLCRTFSGPTQKKLTNKAHQFTKKSCGGRKPDDEELTAMQHVWDAWTGAPSRHRFDAKTQGRSPMRWCPKQESVWGAPDDWSPYRDRTISVRRSLSALAHLLDCMSPASLIRHKTQRFTTCGGDSNRNVPNSR